MTNAKKHAAIVTPVLDLVEKEDGKTAWTLTRSASEDDSTRYCLPNFCRFLVAFASTLLLLNVILPDLPSTNCGQMFSKRLTSACLYRAGSIALVALFCGLGAYKFRRWRCLLALGGATLPSWRGRGLLLALALSLVVPRNAHVVLVNIRRGEAYFQCRLTELERAGTGVGRTIDPLASKANRHALPEGEDEEERMFWSTFAKTPLVFFFQFVLRKNVDVKGHEGSGIGYRLKNTHSSTNFSLNVGSMKLVLTAVCRHLDKMILYEKTGQEMQ